MFNTTIFCGEDILTLCRLYRDMKKRFCYKDLQDYLYDNANRKVCVLYGLRRTGKTVMMLQSILDMTENNLKKTAYIVLRKHYSFSDVLDDIRSLYDMEYKYLFIDEVTLIDEFVDMSSILADIYTTAGMHIVLSGTDSLGFWLAEANELYDRVKMIHTTFISFAEHEHLLGTATLDDYIKFGGTLTPNETFKDSKHTFMYVNTAISYNIQNSLERYNYSQNFRNLYELYSCNKLTNVINRVIQKMNHLFALRTIQERYKARDLSTAIHLLNKDLYGIDKSSITLAMQSLLDIKDFKDLQVKVNENHLREVVQYLKRLDLITELPYENILLDDDEYFINTDESTLLNKHYIFTQPGLRFSQSMELCNLIGEGYQELHDKIKTDILGLLTEDHVLLETMLIRSNQRVFKLSFDTGEYDMAVVDPNSRTIELYEIKHSAVRDKNQCRHLRNEKALHVIEHRYSSIVKRCVLYNGNDFSEPDGIMYKNITKYLSGLYTENTHVADMSSMNRLEF